MVNVRPWDNVRRRQCDSFSVPSIISALSRRAVIPMGQRPQRTRSMRLRLNAVQRDSGECADTFEASAAPAQRSSPTHSRGGMVRTQVTRALRSASVILLKYSWRAMGGLSLRPSRPIPCVSARLMSESLTAPMPCVGCDVMFDTSLRRRGPSWCGHPCPTNPYSRGGRRAWHSMQCAIVAI
jgi:hypothetical protein